MIFLGCSKDLGNYNYKTLNKLDSVLNAPNQNLEGRTFSLTFGDVLKIDPIIYNSLDEKTEYDFYWVFNGDTLSREKNLVLDTKKISAGTVRSNLVLFDQIAKVKYSIAFTINLTASVIKGYVLLTEDENQNSILFYKGNDINSKFFYYNKIGETILGKRPINLELIQVYQSATEGHFDKIIVSSREGLNPIIVGDAKTNRPTILFDKNSAMRFDNPPNGFQPDVVKFNGTAGLASVNGKVHTLASGIVGPNVYNDPLDYDFKDGEFFVNTRTFNGLMLAGYDYKNEKIRIFASRVRSPENNYQMSLDDIIKMDTKGHQILGGVESMDSWYFCVLITKKNNELFIHRIDHGSHPSSGYIPEKHSIIAQKTISEIEKAVDFRYRLGSQYWYFASGRSLYMFSNLGLDIQKVLTLPEDGSGDITSWNFDNNEAGEYDYIVLATYNPTENSEFKGSVYTYKIDGKEPINIDKYSTYKVVDLECGHLPY